MQSEGLADKMELKEITNEMMSNVPHDVIVQSRVICCFSGGKKCFMSLTALSVFYINPPMAQSAQGLEEEQVLGSSAGVSIFQKRKKKNTVD